MHKRPYGSWPSPITTDHIVGQSRAIREPRWHQGRLYWLETRPEEKGRCTLLFQVENHAQMSATQEALPSPWSIQSKAHEYGGAGYCLANLPTESENTTLFFCEKADQRIYQFTLGSATPTPISPEDSCRYADLVWDQYRQRLLAIRETHSEDGHHSKVVNDLVAITPATGEVTVLACGEDFYSNPRLSPCGQYCLWLSWNHPQMPWDNTNLWRATFDKTGHLTYPEAIAGSASGHPEESIFQPDWSPSGDIIFVSDRDNWWQLYGFDAKTTSSHLITQAPINAEFATPQWVFGMSTWGFINESTIFATYTQEGAWQAAVIHIENGQLMPLDLPHTHIESIATCPHSQQAAFLGASATTLTQLVTASTSLSAENAQHIALDYSVICEQPLQIAPECLSQPESIRFGDQAQPAQGFFYSPTNPDVDLAEPAGSEGDLPPLIVLCHGGPTGMNSNALNLKVQYWTSRGFAVLDVNYRGSTGFGRAFRHSLHNQWGVFDVEDVCAGANALVAQGKVDKHRLAIKGSSAGGYTVLSALTFKDTFRAGASLYGIGDLETLATDTHKFEAHYLDRLIGPYPEQKSLYQQRSPINYVEQLTCPVIFLQGLEDKVVPPNQAESMVNALNEKDIPVAYLTFEEEGHGFRQAPNIARALEAELYFYGQMFGFRPDEEIEPMNIANWE